MLAKQKMFAASLLSRKHGFGVPIHMKMTSHEHNIDYRTLLVLNGDSHSNYIALAIDPFSG